MKTIKEALATLTQRRKEAMQQSIGTLQSVEDKTTQNGKPYCVAVIDGTRIFFWNHSAALLQAMVGTQVGYTWEIKNDSTGKPYPPRGEKIFSAAAPGQVPPGAPVLPSTPPMAPTPGPTPPVASSDPAQPSIDSIARFMSNVVGQCIAAGVIKAPDDLRKWTEEARKAIRDPFLPVIVQQAVAQQEAQNLGDTKEDVPW